MQVIDAPYWPNRIIQGCGTIKRLPQYVQSYNGKKCFFFTDGNILETETTQAAINSLCTEGYDVYVYDDIEQNPSDNSVKKAAETMRRYKPDFVIYYGGGSVIDLGKAANVIYTHGGEVYDYEDLNGGIEKIHNELLPSVAIATTAGSGSEVSSVSVITDTHRHLKMAILSPYIVPTISVLDPIVTATMPPRLTAYTGMDALAHAIEAYVSNIQFEPGRGIAFRGMELISKSLRQAVYNGNDLKARLNMLVGSTCGAMAFNNNFLGAVHGCAHQLSTIAALPHGLANAVMLPVVMEWNLPSNIDAFAEIAPALGVKSDNLSKRQAAEQSVAAVRTLAKDIGIPSHLSKVGVSQKMIDIMVDNAFIDHNMLTNPRKSHSEAQRISKDEIRALYMAAF